MYYTIYKITNLVNNKFYIGAHATNNLDDGYMGSGKLIRRAIEKYGIENFSKEYICNYENAEEMFLAESEIVNEELIRSPNSYNLIPGGIGNSWYVSNLDSELQRQRASKSNAAQKELRKDPEWAKRKSEKISESLKKAYQDGSRISKLPSWEGKKHREETKRKIGEANSKHQAGSGNSQFGTCWIYSEERRESRRVDKEELKKYIDDGWLKGRKIKF